MSRINAALSVCLAAAIALSGCTSQDALSTQQVDVQTTTLAPSSPSTPSEASVADTQSVLSEHERTIESLRLQAGQSPEELAKNAFETNLSEWYMDGADSGHRQRSIDYLAENGYAKLPGHYADIAKGNASFFTEAMYDDVYSLGIDTLTKRTIAINTWVLDVNLRTIDDPEPFTAWSTVDSVSVIAERENTRTLRVNLTGHDNAKTGNNMALKIMENSDTFDGIQSEIDVRFKTVDGYELITGIVIRK